MLDRRQEIRGRVYYGGIITFNARHSTMACLVRNFSALGAKVELANTTLLPHEFDFTVARRGFSCVARLVWRRAEEAGLVFQHPKHANAPIPLDWAIRLRASERARKDLVRRIEQLRSEY
jgi:PilZ domain